MNKTKIAWCDYTWNPVSGCTKVSEGCRNCYAASMAKRFWGERRFSDVVCHEDKLNEPLKVKKPARVFVNSMSDLFHPDVSDGFISSVFDVMKSATNLTFIVLTKRPARMQYSISYPLSNVWLGVSIEDQKTADERIPLLLQTPAAVRFVSYEPALDLVDLTHDLDGYRGNGTYVNERINWVIMGCESGPKRRPMNIDWARSMQGQCEDAGVPFFLKQMEIGGKVVSEPELDGKQWLQFPGGEA